MLTRSRSSLYLAQQNGEASDANVDANGKKKRQVNPSKSPDKTKRTRKAVTKADVKQTKLKPKSDVLPESPKLPASNSSITRKSPQKTKRTRAAIKVDEGHTKSKHTSSNSLNGMQSESNLVAPKTKNSTEYDICYSAIQQVLATNYMDVQKRLKLFYPAKCLQSAVTCREEHVWNSEMDISDDMMTAQTFLKNHQPLMFIHVILMDVLGGKFPGRNFMPLFELIVSINEPSLGEYNVADVIDMAAYAITRIMERFPPCWLAANKEYRTFLGAQNKQLIAGNENFLANHTLFEDLINYVESAIQAPAKHTKTTHINDSFAHNSLNDSLLNDSQELQCFQKFELKHTQKYSFDILPRDQKIHRIFTALSLYVQLFEADLAMWTLRNIQKPSNRIFDRQNGALIGSVLWTKNEPNQVNYTIKKILKLFVDYVSIDFSNDETHILGRLVNLIFNIFDLSASQNESDINYPRPVEEHSYFCDAFIKIISDSNSCCIDLWFKIIKNVLHPKLKLYLINALLTKIEHQKIALNPESIYRTMDQLESGFDYNMDKTNSQNNNLVKTKKTIVGSVAGAGAGACVTKYPYLQKVNKRVASTLSYEQQVEIYLIALRAYMDIYHVDEAQDYWNNYDRYTVEREMALDRYKKDCEAMQNEAVEPYDLEEMQKLQKKSFDKRIKKLSENSYIPRLDVVYEVVGCCLHSELKPNVKKYRNDAKFVDLIANQMKNLRTMFGPLFPVNKYSK